MRWSEQCGCLWLQEGLVLLLYYRTLIYGGTWESRRSVGGAHIYGTVVYLI